MYFVDRDTKRVNFCITNCVVKPSVEVVGSERGGGRSVGKIKVKEEQKLLIEEIILSSFTN